MPTVAGQTLRAPTLPGLAAFGQRGATMVSSKALPGFLVAVNIGLASSVALAAGPMGLKDDIAREAQAQDAKVIAWRRDIHAHPELGNQEQRTSALVADHLRNLGLEVRTGVARTGVVGHPAREPARSRCGAARRHGCLAGQGA